MNHEAPQADLTSPPPRRRALARARAIIGTLATLGLLAVVVAEAFAWLLPQRLMDASDGYLPLAAASTFIRVFQLHIGLGVLGLVAMLLVARWWRTTAVAAVTMLALLLPYARDLAPKQPPPAASRSFRLMSINLYARNRDEAAIMRAIDAANPDVLVILEVTPWSMQNIIRKHLLGRYSYVNQPRMEGVGTVMSRIPCRVGEAAANEGGSFEWRPVLIDLAGREVALYGVHLLSPGSLSLVAQNRRQVTVFSGIASAERRPMILAGDCNFTQLTPNAASLRRAGLRSSHELIGFGLGNTWGPRWWPRLNRLPGVRIDHVWLSPELTVTSHAVGLNAGSDHRPVIADIAIAGSHEAPAAAK